MPAFIVYQLRGGSDAASPPDDLAARMATLPVQNRVNLNGMWIIQSDGTSDQIRDELKEAIRTGDGLLVLEVGKDAAWAGVGDDVGEWLLHTLSDWQQSPRRGGYPG